MKKVTKMLIFIEKRAAHSAPLSSEMGKEFDQLGHSLL